MSELGLAWIRRNVGANFSARWYSEDTWTSTCCMFIMRTDFGSVLTVDDFLDLARLRSAGARWQRNSEYCGYGPVPGVRKHRGGGHYFRRMRHMNERRQAALVVEEEGEVAPRAARNLHGLPNPWDDYPCHSRDNRNWKRFRKTRWK
ncbi:hypothetical protein [Burkholderia cenocepacia]|uniref:hypothetical protein n=1 Tax=Burkholderia cenocepacia TaxID=95486 RepID=UPI00136520B4|nr:hypothetical protein [Burkholderia cenocepacia]